MQSENWIKTIKKLSCVQRFSQTQMAKPENVLEHTAMVGLISYNIGLRLLTEEEGHVVSLGQLLSKALIHDIEESEIGDVARPLKYNSKNMRDAFAIVELDFATTILSQAGMLDALYRWEESKQNIEGRIVKYADSLCALAKFHDEIVIRGNKSMIPLISPTMFENINMFLSNIIEGNSVPEVISDYKQLNEKLEKEICSFR